MAADVSYLVRLMNGGDAIEPAGESTALITQDLLGGCSTTVDSQDLDLGLQVPCGWEKRLDLKSGKVYIQRSDSLNTSNSQNKPQSNHPSTKFQDLNFPPTSSKPTLNLFNNSNLDLQLASPSSSAASPSSSNYQSVCTLDKVKSALERAEKESGKKRSWSTSKPSSPISNSSSSTKDCDLDQDEKMSAPMAAGCPFCLMYVLISKNNPKCPRCCSNVPLPSLDKKPRIDLNISI